MIYYMIRHKKSGEFMPEMKRGRGYTHWNPSNLEHKNKQAKNIPRLISSIRMARRVCSNWVNMPNSRTGGYNSYDGEWVDDVISKADGRKIEDIEIVEVDIVEKSIIVSKLP